MASICKLGFAACFPPNPVPFKNHLLEGGVDGNVVIFKPSRFGKQSSDNMVFVLLVLMLLEQLLVPCRKEGVIGICSLATELLEELTLKEGTLGRSVLGLSR